MRVISWNLGAAFGPYRVDHDRAWRWIAAADPDIALIQECAPPPWAYDRWSIHHLRFEHWASAVVTRREADVVPVIPAPGSTVERAGAYLATVEWQSSSDAILVASVHTRAAEAPPWLLAGRDPDELARPSVGVPWWNDAVYRDYLELSAGRRFIVGGDWNTARYLDSDGRPTEDGQAFFDRADADGWIDISLMDGREGRSWYGTDNPRPYQPDHVFTDAATARLLTRALIDPSPAAVFALSDHAPLVLELDEVAAGTSGGSEHRTEAPGSR